MTRDTLFLRLRDTNRRTIITAAVAVAIALASGTAGYLIAAGGGAASPSGRPILYWYDPMIPQERYPGPGKSSMNMDLIPKYADEADEAGVRVSPAMQQNLGVRLAMARMQDIAPSLRAVGRVELDERLIAEVQTLTAGFVESLAVRAVGEPVAQGRRIASVYSPELLTAQNEYQAVLAAPRGAGSPGLRQAARSRLRLLGLPPAMIAALERGAPPQRTYPITAPASGIVTQIGVRPGGQVAPGQSLLTIAGFARVLVIAEVPETMLADMRVGLPVEVSFPAYPDEVRTGRIDYIYPRLNPEARTARLRVTLANPGGRLREGMFANLDIQGTGASALVVPSEAVIDTGRRKVVVVRRGTVFRPAEVRTGRDAGAWTQILAGLQPGDQVVASGQFLIDSEASLSGFLDRLQSPAARPGR
ncbi:efflux RND transporter periplasmic adaptor subunit [Sphingosinicella sp. LHD-64]|uniref:efflux RND transporter periplasmic adaptor subunit n=1 Tax=Sphingosinicella sp. LHD-64 TaxID=3072139 RepID=UPI00280D409B|nr:efflux RND transporter periplasmic adaptor subunit [Sphingosinicella sp. LHD-64]MDQ8757384.1 efflux RND transporter periplasmic adaptor subunit [Sphingosinicella sp. LHD-64]